MLYWLCALLLLVSCEKKTATESIRPVKAIQVNESISEDNQVVFPGTLRAFKRTELSFRIDGIVMARDIAVGQKVSKTEVLIKLDPREYEIAFKKAQSKAESIQAQLDFASRDYVRMQKIYETDSGAISLSLLDRKKETSNQLKAELTMAQTDEDKAADDLSYTLLKAPFDGVITAIYVENYEQVRAKQPVVRLIDIAEREMEISVPEKYINQLLEGGTNLKFKIRLDVFPDQTFSASIKEIGTEASSTTQTYPVTLTLHDIPLETSLLSGMSGKATLQEAKMATSQTTSFKIPRSAVFTDNAKQSYVWVVDPESQVVHRKPVEVSEGRSDFDTVKEGLEVGEWVVIAGTNFLSEGQKVKLVTEQASQ